MSLYFTAMSLYCTVMSLYVALMLLCCAGNVSFIAGPVFPIPPMTLYNITIQNIGTTNITALTFTATNLVPITKWGFINVWTAPSGTFTILPQMFPIQPGQIITQLGYIQLTSLGAATFVVNSITN